LTDCEHEWNPLEFEDGEKSKAQVCLKCGALKSGQGSMVITANYVDFSTLTSNPTLAEGRVWFRSDGDRLNWSPDGSNIERIKALPLITEGSLTGIKGFVYNIEGGGPGTSWTFTANPSVAQWIRQYATAGCFNPKGYNVRSSYENWEGDNEFVDVPNKSDDLYGGEILSVSMIPDGTEISRFDSPGTEPRGLTWDGQYLWVADYGSLTVYRIEKDGTQVSSFAPPASDPRGMTWDGEYLWLTDATALVIYQLKTDGTQVTSVANPTSHDGMVGAWDGEYLWHHDITADYLYKILPDGTVKGGFATGGGAGTTWDGEYLWHTRGGQAAVYQYKRDGTRVSKFAFPTNYDGGWDGGYLWVAGRASDTIYQIGNSGNFDLDYKIVRA